MAEPLHSFFILPAASFEASSRTSCKYSKYTTVFCILGNYETEGGPKKKSKMSKSPADPLRKKRLKDDERPSAMEYNK